MSTDSFNIYQRTKEEGEYLTAMNTAKARLEAAEKRLVSPSSFKLQEMTFKDSSSLQRDLKLEELKVRSVEEHLAELKAHLEAVYNADLASNELLQSITGRHCISYALHLLHLLTTVPSGLSIKSNNAAASGSLIELACSAIDLFAQRPSMHDELAAVEAPQALVRVLSPLHSILAVCHAASAAGHMAAHERCRLALRTAGAVGALVRLLRGDVAPRAQAAAASALALLAAADAVTQDAVRYLGGLQLLVDMLASSPSEVAEVAKMCLKSLRHNNPHNSAEISATITASTSLGKDLVRLQSALELVHSPMKDPEAPRTPEKSTYLGSWATPPRTHTTSTLRAGERRYTVDDPKSAVSQRGLGNEGYDMRASPTKTSYRKYTDDVKTPVSKGFAEDGADERTSPSKYTYKGVISPRTPERSPRRADGASAMKSTATYSPGFTAASGGYYSGYNTPGKSVGLVGSAAVSPELREALRYRHVVRLDVDGVAALLEEAGLEASEVSRFRSLRVDGPKLLVLDDDDLAIRMLLPRHKAKKILSIQRAVSLFDRISSLQNQSSISAPELEAYCTRFKVRASDAQKAISLITSLTARRRSDLSRMGTSRNDSSASTWLNAIPHWDFVLSYEWVAPALKIYSVPS